MIVVDWWNWMVLLFILLQKFISLAFWFPAWATVLSSNIFSLLSLFPKSILLCFTDAHMNSERLWQHALDLHRIKPYGVPSLIGESGHWVSPLTKKLFAIETYWQWEKSVFFNGVSLGISTTLQGRPPGSRAVGQHNTNSMFVFLVWFCLLLCFVLL